MPLILKWTISHKYIVTKHNAHLVKGTGKHLQKHFVSHYYFRVLFLLVLLKGNYRILKNVIQRGIKHFKNLHAYTFIFIKADVKKHMSPIKVLDWLHYGVKLN